MRKIPFDTLAYANRMKSAGMEPQLAEEQAEAMAEVLYDGLDAKLDHLVTKEDAKSFVTKEDLKNYPTKEDFKNELKHYPTKEDLRNELKNYPTKEDLKNELKNFVTKEDLKTELINLETRFEAKFATKDELKTACAELKVDIADVRSELIKWMIGLIAGSTTFISTLVVVVQLVK